MADTLLTPKPPEIADGEAPSGTEMMSLREHVEAVVALRLDFSAPSGTEVALLRERVEKLESDADRAAWAETVGVNEMTVRRLEALARRVEALERRHEAEDEVAAGDDA